MLPKTCSRVRWFRSEPELSRTLTFRAKSENYELVLEWPQPIDPARATKSFGKKTRKLTVLAPVLS